MSGMDLAQFKGSIVAPAIAALGLPGDLTARIQLHTGIALAESGLQYKRQIGGPALGYCQMEPATHDDCWINYLDSLPGLAAIVLGYLPARFAGHPVGAAEAMVESDAYSVAMAAIRFRRSPIALPAASDAHGQCAAWKRGYNTTLGAGQIDPEHIALFQQAIDA